MTDPTNPFAPMDNKGWLDPKPIDPVEVLASRFVQAVGRKSYGIKAGMWDAMIALELIAPAIVAEAAPSDNARDAAAEAYDKVIDQYRIEPCAFKRACFRAGWDAAIRARGGKAGA
jgi:hypothetical protein